MQLALQLASRTSRAVTGLRDPPHRSLHWLGASLDRVWCRPLCVREVRLGLSQRRGDAIDEPAVPTVHGTQEAYDRRMARREEVEHLCVGTGDGEVERDDASAGVRELWRCGKMVLIAFIFALGLLVSLGTAGKEEGGEESFAR